MSQSNLMEDDLGGTLQPCLHSAQEITDWLVKYCAHVLGTHEAPISLKKTFTELGMESVMMVVMTEELTTWLGKEVDPTAPYDHPSIEELASYAARGLQPET